MKITYGELESIFQKEYLDGLDADVLEKLKIGNAAEISHALKGILRSKLPENQTITLNNFLEKYNVLDKELSDFSEGDVVFAFAKNKKSVSSSERHITFALGGKDGEIVAYGFNQKRKVGDYDGGSVDQCVMKISLGKRIKNGFLVDKIFGIYDRGLLTEPVENVVSTRAPQKNPNGNEIMLSNGYGRNFFAQDISMCEFDVWDSNLIGILKSHLIKIRKCLSGELEDQDYENAFYDVWNKRIDAKKRLEAIEMLLLNLDKKNLVYTKDDYIQKILLKEVGAIIIRQDGYL